VDAGFIEVIEEHQAFGAQECCVIEWGYDLAFLVEPHTYDLLKAFAILRGIGRGRCSPILLFFTTYCL